MFPRENTGLPYACGGGGGGEGLCAVCTAARAGSASKGYAAVRDLKHAMHKVCLSTSMPEPGTDSAKRAYHARLTQVPSRSCWEFSFLSSRSDWSGLVTGRQGTNEPPGLPAIVPGRVRGGRSEPAAAGGGGLLCMLPQCSQVPEPERERERCGAGHPPERRGNAGLGFHPMTPMFPPRSRLSPPAPGPALCSSPTTELDHSVVFDGMGAPSPP